MKKTVIITGAAGGIGRATCLQFAEAGYQVVASDIQITELEKLAQDLKSMQAGFLISEGNLEDPDYWQRLIADTLSRFGSIDVLVNNAAWRVSGSARTQTLETWERTLRVCLTAPVFLTQQAAAVMEKQGKGGVVVNISSMMAARPSGLVPGYIAAKGAIESLTKELAVTYGRQGIRVVGVAPGYIETPLSNDYTDQSGENISQKLIDHLVDFVPANRGGKPEEIAQAIVWLSSDGAGYISGTTLLVDGGFTPNFNAYSIKHLQYPEEF